MIDKAQKLLETATYNDIRKIRECVAELMREYALVAQNASKMFQQYELKRAQRFLELREKKIKSDSKMTVQDIDRQSKVDAYNGYEQEKTYARVLNKYIDLLRDLRIELMHENKQSDL